ncbi:MAG: glycosyl hydrolase family 28-related protein [Planctomycetota bacterium]
MAAAALVTLAAFGTLGNDAYGASGRRHSELWGERGEKWEPGGRLSDFSYAGYRMGERPIPLLPVAANVKAFGAKGDGETDDTEAFKEAIRRTNSGAILVPPGKYVITDFIEIAKGGIVLRGAGPDKTTLYFPKYLNDIKPNWGATTGGRRTSNYSWGGGYLVLRSRVGGRELAKLAAPAKRGDRALTLSKRVSVSPGDFVEIRQHDNDDNLLAHCLYAGQPGDMRKLNGRTRTSHVSRVVSVQGERLTIERALLADADPKWGAAVREFRATATDSGVEDVAFEFPVKPYGGTSRSSDTTRLPSAGRCTAGRGTSAS